jgi:DNA-binding PadR family transcriptional regulator
MTEYMLTNAELAILSLIAEKPRHGYELEQVIEERGMRDWTEIAFSSIYFILNGLEKKGLAGATLQLAAGRGPAKKVFSATPHGLRVLHDGIWQALSTEGRGDLHFLLGLSCLPLLTFDEVESAFNQRISFLASKIEEISHHPTLTLSGIPMHVYAMFEYSLFQLRAELDWSLKFLDTYLTGENQHGQTGS